MKFHNERLMLEKEIMLLRSAREENLLDESRHRYVLLSLEETNKKLLSRIGTLEDFIIEQDEVRALSF